MKRIKITLNTILLFSILTMFTPCIGQNASQHANAGQRQTICDTVSELSKCIMFIFQASNGDYWFGCDGEGIFRYDGTTIVNYLEYNGLTNRFRGIQEDKKGNIYFTSIDGIRKFDGHSFSTLTPIISNSAIDNWKLQPDDLWFTFLDKNGENAPFRYDGKNLYQLKFPKNYLEDEYHKKNIPRSPWSLSPYDVYTIYKDSKGNVWFGTAAFGVCRYDGKTLNWLYEKHLTESETGFSFGIRSIFEDKEGKFWFGNNQYRYHIYPNDTSKNENNLIKYKREKGLDQVKSWDNDEWLYFTSIVEDKNQDLWLATSNGVWRYDTSTEHRTGSKNITHYDAEGNMLCYIYKDNNSDIWLGILLAGAYKFNGKVFEKFNPKQK